MTTDDLRAREQEAWRELWRSHHGDGCPVCEGQVTDAIEARVRGDLRPVHGLAECAFCDTARVADEEHDPYPRLLSERDAEVRALIEVARWALPIIRKGLSKGYLADPDGDEWEAYERHAAALAPFEGSAGDV